MSKTGTFLQVPNSQEGATPRLVTETEPLPVSLFDGSGNPISSLGGAIDVHDADIHTNSINHYFWRELGTHTLAAPLAAQATSATLVDATGIVVGSDLHFNDTITGEHDHTFVTVTAVAGNVITFNRPIDAPYTVAGCVISRVTHNMAVTGSLASPVSYIVRPLHGNVWHVTSMSFSIIDNSPMDDATFGGIVSLANGVAVRVHDVTNGQYYTYSFWNENSDFFLDCFEIQYADKAPSGLYGFRGKLNVKEMYDAIVKLSNTADSVIQMEVLIQDDLSGLTAFEMSVHGHREGLE